jgi:signal transduction histidine kinase
MNHLDRIVDNIVKFARNAEPQMRLVDLPGLLDDLALLTRHKLQHQQIHLVREDAPDLPPVKGDATQLSQAFLNLILNAAEAMQQGGTLQIATKVTEQGVTGPVTYAAARFCSLRNAIAVSTSTKTVSLRP